jgi:hypothetical protein
MFTVIGSVLPNCHEYMKNIRRQYHDLRIDWRLNLSPEDVADNMNKATYAYLHYPDCVSIRSSSLLAALGNGLITIGNRGVQASDEVSSAVCFAESPKEALSILENLVININLLEAMRQRTKRFIAQFTREHIALQHINL